MQLGSGAARGTLVTILAAVLASACGSASISSSTIVIDRSDIRPTGSLARCSTGGVSPAATPTSTTAESTKSIAGHLELVGDGGTYVVDAPFDASPAPTPRAMDVAGTAGAMGTSWSSQRDAVSFIDNTPRSRVVVVDLTSGRTTTLGPSRGDEAGTTLSGDGSTVVLLDGDHLVDIRSRDAGAELVRLPAGLASNDSHPSVDDRGERVGVQASDDNSARAGGRYVVTGRHREVPIVIGGLDWPVIGGSVSPNGRCAAVFAARSDSGDDLYVVDLETHRAHTICRLPSKDRFTPVVGRWSPDGRELAMVVGGFNTTGSGARLVVSDLAAGRCAAAPGRVDSTKPPVFVAPDTVAAIADRGERPPGTPDSVLVSRAATPTAVGRLVATIPVVPLVDSLMFRPADA